jgi:Subtilase family
VGRCALSRPASAMLRRLACWSLSLTVTVMLLGAFSVRAEELPVTVQARAANAAWLPYAPMPNGGARTLCLVDTGLELNADLATAIVGRAALDGGTVEDVDPHKHGTSMAMIAAAARNGAGMVGAWPAIRVRSVRAASASTDGGTTRFAFADYARAIRVCQSSPDVAAIVLALSGAEPASSAETETFTDYVVKAHDRGMSVVAAAGNDDGPVTTPASLPGVLAVGASDAGGALCAFSSRGAGLDLLAPGCGLDTADPDTLARLTGAGGSSQASVFAATALVALRSYRPELSWEQAENLLRTAPNGVLEVAAAFRAAGLGAVVDVGMAAIPPEPHATHAPGLDREAGAAEPLRPFPAPRAWASCRAGHVAVHLARRPPDALAVVRVLKRSGGRLHEVTRSTRRHLDIRLRRCPAGVAVRFEDRYGEQAFRSQTTVVAVRRIGRQ